VQVEENRRRLPYVDWHVADLDAADGKGAPETLRDSFDVVIASELIEHLDHPEALLRNARELARPGTGHLLLSTQSGPLRETERRVGHRRHWSRTGMNDALVRTGWAPIRLWNCGFPFHDLSKWYANRDAEGSMSRFSENPYGVREDLVCLALRLAFRFNSRSHGAQLYAVARRSAA
jgi:SAM-dependent methyltransferase